MLTDLSITNIAIIDTLHLTLRPGLTVLTGETGAGKSIIIDAVGLIMGGRASVDLIRSGTDEASVEAIFDISGCPEVQEILEQAGLEAGTELLVKRSISRSGKNRIFINGSLATLAILTDIAGRLINIYGQHESQTLLRTENQLTLLDAFAGCMPLRERFAGVFKAHAAVIERLENLDAHERETARRLDLLSFQAEEIAAAGLKVGEEEDLEEQHRILASAGKLGSVSSEAFEVLYGGDGAILGQLRRISSSVREIAAIDQGLGDLASSLEEAYLQLEDSAISLRDYASRVESDPQALQQADDRLDQISRLKRKYGATVEEVLSFKLQIDTELEELHGREHDRQKLETERNSLREQLRECGRELTAQRTKHAARLKQALEAEAHQLAMKGAIIEPALEPLTEARSSGFERVEFLFSPNPGEPPRPLAKIASGGELSRLMLAFKQVLPEGDVPTLIFDEVDTGISGATSELVGKKLKNVADRQQVLCITHLPQVASCAHHHLRIEKLVREGRTSTAVTELRDDDRIREIARLLAGETITDSALKHATEMLAAKVDSKYKF
jgi:DNA repair protein RecN (Recombination protein N)